MTPYRSTLAEVRHVRCGYGGSGPAPPGYYSVMPYFDVTAARRLTGLRMTALHVEDVARDRGPIELRIWMPGLDRDHNELTRPFDGIVEAGETLRLRAAMMLTPVPPSLELWRLRYSADLVCDQGDGLVVSGPLDAPWPTG